MSIERQNVVKVTKKYNLCLIDYLTFLTLFKPLDPDPKHWIG